MNHPTLPPFNRTFLAALAIVALGLAPLSSANPVRDGQVEAELIPEVTSIQPGAPFTVALRLTHDPKWHTYWINDGDAGLPTTIRWTLPDGFTAGPIQWPLPERIEMPPLVNFGYENTVHLLVEITPPDTLAPGTEVTLDARVDWLMCDQICIPGRASFSLNLPVAAEAAPDPDRIDLFSTARDQLPLPSGDWQVAAEALAQTIVLILTPPPGFDASLDRVHFFPEPKSVIQNAGEQTWEKLDGFYRMTIPRATTINPLPERLAGVFVSLDTPFAPRRQALAFDIPWGAASGSPPATSSDTQPLSLPVAAAMAFIGGIILNLMPCVFPVISIKILGFVNQAQEDPKRVWHHGLVFGAGVLISFWILAGLLIALRAGGMAFGWGFQLSSPIFVTALLVLFFLIALNLFGVFEIGMSLTSAGSELEQKGGWSGSFFSGALATVVATPCSAPLMGAAIGFALGQSALHALVIFTFLGVGMAFPYLLLSRYPALLRKLPRPGPWMETMKQIMAFLLLATGVWLFWVLSFLVTPLALSWLMFTLLGIALGAWIYGKWGAIHRPPRTQRIATVLALLFIGGSLYAGMTRMTPLETQIHDAASVWEPFDAGRLAELQAEGRPVFIDFTARWCLTCQVNKQAVLQTRDVLAAFADHGVTLMVADWTDQNERIGSALAALGRQSVPVYALYGRNGGEPTLLPEILTRGIVIDALRNLN
ncbi:MAG TPA: protein-disulfide reductase DsbD family protein [Kiritimatiellia bacterium]|nr:protein-disulfide reductase DsbD family protein [Kiritimatiellia bacterium]